MKKTLMVLGMLSVVVAYGQEGRVGINTETPAATLDVVASRTAVATSAQGVIFPRLASETRAKFQGVAEGTMIYNTTKKCLELFKGLDSGGDMGWHCTETVVSRGFAVRFASFLNTYGVKYAKAHEKNIISTEHFDNGNTYEYDKANGVIKFTVTNNSGVDLVGKDFTNAVKVSYPLMEGETEMTLSVRGFDTQNVTIRNGESKTLEYRLIGNIYNAKLYNLNREKYVVERQEVEVDLSEWGSAITRFNFIRKDTGLETVKPADDALYPKYPVDFIFEDEDLNLYIEKTILTEPYMEFL